MLLKIIRSVSAWCNFSLCFSLTHIGCYIYSQANLCRYRSCCYIHSWLWHCCKHSKIRKKLHETNEGNQRRMKRKLLSLIYRAAPCIHTMHETHILQHRSMSFVSFAGRKSIFYWGAHRMLLCYAVRYVPLEVCVCVCVLIEDRIYIGAFGVNEWVSEWVNEME